MAQNVKLHLKYANSGMKGFYFWKQNYDIIWNT